MKIFFLPVFLISMLFGCAQRELLPGEEAYNTQVEAAEELIQTTKEGIEASQEACGKLRKNYDEGVTAFKIMMPNLKGLSLQKRDARLGAIQDFVKERCQN